ncbi:MAG: Uma2 family endonuclease [Cyanobacteria bacterium SBLK]|nr:Uma2 family endonuclease [Cyanobacteria bacterium SBLK]
MVQAIPKPFTLEEFLKLPETKPASEYINGKIIQKPMPQGHHSVIQGELYTALNAILKPAKIARAFPELRCIFGGRSTVPDICVFIWERIPRDENGKIANIFRASPDWTIEILSPEQRSTRVVKNILHCLQHQTQMGWLIDPEEETVLVYCSQQQVEFFDEPQQVLPVPTFAKDFKLTVGELFNWLSE